MSESAVIELSQSEIDFLEYFLNIGIVHTPTAEYTLAGFKLKNNILEQAKENKSAIKWNLPVKTPNNGVVLVKRTFRTKPQIAYFVLGRFETVSQEPIPNADIDAWAYLPK